MTNLSHTFQKPFTRFESIAWSTATESTVYTNLIWPDRQGSYNPKEITSTTFLLYYVNSAFTFRKMNDFCCFNGAML